MEFGFPKTTDITVDNPPPHASSFLLSRSRGRARRRTYEVMIRPHPLVGVVGLSSVRRLENLDSDPFPDPSNDEAVVAFVREMGGRIAQRILPPERIEALVSEYQASGLTQEGPTNRVIVSRLWTPNDRHPCR